MSQDIGLDPYLDYSAISEEMTEDLCAAVREQEAAKQEMATQPSRQAVERLLKSVDVCAGTIAAIEQAILTLPSIVHIAGEPQEDADQHGHDEECDCHPDMVQRCVRCSSPLVAWSEGIIMMDPSNGELIPVTLDSVDWLEPGTTVAKVNMQGGDARIYTVDLDKLEPHERECVAMPDLGVDL